MRLDVLMLAGLALAGCAATPPPPVTIPQPVEVAVPVVAKCDIQIAPEPAYPDSDQAIASATDLTGLAKIYRGGRALRQARIAYLTALLKQCVG